MHKLNSEPGRSDDIRSSPEPTGHDPEPQTTYEKKDKSSNDSLLGNSSPLIEENGLRIRPPEQYDDPAFSSDSRDHPDHSGSPIDNQINTWNINADEPPPYEQVAISPSASPTVDVPAEAQYTSPIESRPSSSHSLVVDFSGQGTDGEESIQDDNEQNALLAYLQDEENDNDNELHDGEEDIPMSLRPHMGLPLRQQSTSEFESRGRPNNVTDLQRSATLPPVSTVTNGEPFAQAENERPRPARRLNTTSPGRHAPNLGIIDELDENTPFTQDRGRYQLQGRALTPPTRANTITRIENKNAAPMQRVVITENASSPIPQALPFRINLNPGEFLTRIPPPPPSGQVRPPSMQPYMAPTPAPAMQPIYQESRSLPQSRNSSQIFHTDNGRSEWSPEQLYEDQGVRHRPVPVELLGNPNLYHTHRSSPSPSTNSSRVDLRPASLLPGIPQNNNANYSPRIGEQRPMPITEPQQSMRSALSRSTSQPFPPSSSAASVFSETSTMSRSPMTAAERHRPKRIVMPAPLQQQNINSYKTGANINQSSTAMAYQAAAAVIPVHDPKKGNMLKKRATIQVQAGSSLHQKHNHLGVERSISTKGFFSSLGSAFGKGLTAEPESKLPKPSRKLSKRKTLF